MSVAGRIFAHSLLCVLLSANLAGCGRKEPPAADIKAAISRTISGYSVNDLKCESFADRNSEAAGRASCRGTLSLDQDLYSPIPPDAIKELLVAAGIPNEGSTFFFDRHQRNVFALTARKGSGTNFVSNCSYSGVVDGWSINCDTNFDHLAGQQMEQGAVLKDSPEYAAYVAEVMADYRGLDEAFKQTKARVEQFFLRGKTVTAYGYSGNAYARATMNTTISWSGAPGFLGYPSKFSVETKYLDLRDNATSTFCGYAKGSPADDIAFSGDINYTPQSPRGVFSASLYMMDRVKLFQNQYQSCGNVFYMEGDFFKSTLSPSVLKSG